MQVGQRTLSWIRTYLTMSTRISLRIHCTQTLKTLPKSMLIQECFLVMIQTSWKQLPYTFHRMKWNTPLCKSSQIIVTSFLTSKSLALLQEVEISKQSQLFYFRSRDPFVVSLHLYRGDSSSTRVWEIVLI
jgi:hypothetical protein